MIIHQNGSNFLLKKASRNFIGEDDLIYNIYIGDQSVESLERTAQELNFLMEKIKNHNKKVLVLTNITKIGKISLSVRKKGLEVLSSLNFNKVAIFGRDDLYKNFIKLLIIASGTHYTVKYFTTENEARDWLIH